MSAPFFSILMPVHNAGRYLGRVLRDLQSQSFRDFEIIAVDDGSTDGSSEVLQQHRDQRLRVVTLAGNRGLVAALNVGLAEARGLWIARQDADDRCRADRLACQRSQILGNPGAVFFYSRARLIDERGWWRGTMRPPLDHEGLRWDLCFRNAIPHTSAVFPAAMVREELGGYTGDNVTADFDLWSRLLRKGGSAGDGRYLVSYRNHAHSIMGREHGSNDKPSNAGLREILLRNLTKWGRGNASEAAVVADTWLAPGNADWGEYFAIRECLVARCPTIPSSLIAEEDYTLLHRAAAVSRDCVSQMMKVMKEQFPHRHASLPQPQTLITRILGRF